MLLSKIKKFLSLTHYFLFARGMIAFWILVWAWTVCFGITLLGIASYSKNPDGVFIVGLVLFIVAFITTPLCIHGLFCKEIYQ